LAAALPPARCYYCTPFFHCCQPNPLQKAYFFSFFA
jgi:hypothetical protein